MKDNSIIFIPGPKAQRNIEAYTEKICDNLFINDTYYGNILMCLTELNELFIENEIENEVELSYETDFNNLSISAIFADNESNSRNKTDNELIHNKVQYQLIETLSDEVLIHENGISLGFNIGALHKSIYESRLKHLKVYFNKMVGIAHES